MQPDQPPELSIVIPIRNEAENLPKLYEELTAALTGFGRPYEILLIDDGSTDASGKILAEMAAARLARQGDPLPPQLRPDRRLLGGIRLRARPDHHHGGRRPPERPARHSGDGPEARRQRGTAYDIVCGWRRDRKDKWLTRRVPSMLANALISKATGVELHDYGCSLKVFRADVVKPLRLYGEMHRFIPAIASEMGVNDRRGRGQSSRAHARDVEIRAVADRAGHPRSARP